MFHVEPAWGEHPCDYIESIAFLIFCFKSLTSLDSCCLSMASKSRLKPALEMFSKYASKSLSSPARASSRSVINQNPDALVNRAKRCMCEWRGGIMLREDRRLEAGRRESHKSDSHLLDNTPQKLHVQERIRLRRLWIAFEQFGKVLAISCF